MKYSTRDVIEQQINIKYLQGKLTQEQTEAFEVFLMEHPDALEDLSLDNILNENVEDAFVNIEKSSKQKVFLAGWWQYGAGIITGAIAMILIFNLTFITKQGMPADQTFVLDNVRSGEQNQNQLVLDVNSRNILLFLSAPPDYQPPLSIQILNKESDRLVFDFRNVPADEIGDIALILNTETLKMTSYRAIVRDQIDQTASYHFALSQK